mgnify:CR=1 FL=1
MTKHEEYYQRMIDENMELFGQFEEIHDNYVLNPQMWQAKYNEIGAKVIEVVRLWEKKLCQHSEKGTFGKFSSKLSDKFWDLVRKDYTKIDFVGET